MNTSSHELDPEGPDAAPKAVAPTGGWLPAVVGLFITIQLGFLVVSNVTSFLFLLLDAHSGPAKVNKALAEVAEGWAKLTGQDQNWRLFAPQVPTRTLLVDVSFHGPALPAAPARPRVASIHWPGPEDRLWHVEKSLHWAYVAYDPKEVAARAGEWQEYLEESVRKKWHAYRDYLAWKKHAYTRQYPDFPAPTELWFGVWVYTLSHQPEPGSPQHHEVLLRWQPGREPTPGTLPLELYDRVSGSFTPILSVGPESVGRPSEKTP